MQLLAKAPRTHLEAVFNGVVNIITHGILTFVFWKKAQ
jgi:hypothetical protein